MGSKIYPKVHENPRAFSCIFGPIFLESSIQYPWGVGLHQLGDKVNGGIPYESLSYGQLISYVQKVALKICKDEKIQRQLAKE